ncbi:DUF3892 domain-containing protein [Pedobacter sp. MC2016-24]|uniref:DUF3892 domain-containing protein n=1 Tax=Pedobacter sp. MC2016-24 TaxID=2780090 RepID=UPI00187E8D18|nr:DUF3892 domain-containing protein [Pedobacter sp. MC2016-24]MBE9598002.1 DUF3892 domain-containing protein [Pedobacter sp. MC2016-24]
MADCRITRITKKNRQSTHDHITHAGNPPTWYWKREDIIASINNKTNTFYVLENGNRSDVGVVNPTDGRSPFLRTYADNVWNDNLLALPEHTP